MPPGNNSFDISPTSLPALSLSKDPSSGGFVGYMLLMSNQNDLLHC